MDALPSFIGIPLRLALLLAGLLVPGSLLLRTLRLPWSLAASFAGSFVALYTTVLLCTFLKVPITFATLAGGLVLICVALFQVHLRQKQVPPHIDPVGSFAAFTRLGRWTPLYLLFWAVVGHRLLTQPLTGPDVYFRWSFLGERMLDLGSLDFYPPQTAAQFTQYFWPESIPPGVASLYAWAYACAGSTRALWTSPVVALQVLAIHELVWRIAHVWGGEAGARRAVLLAAAMPLLTWAVLIGQETGLTAFAVCGLVWSLPRARENNGARWAALAGFFAIVAAAAREYGPAFAVVAVAVAARLRGPRRPALVVALVALPVAAAWPLRVWLQTGNPFYSLEVAGGFPTNRLFADWSRAFHAAQAGAFAAPENWLALTRYLTLWALPACVGLLALGVLLKQGLREVRAVAGFVAVTIALWCWSVPHTAGGFFYSLRVLSPALALLAVVASYALGRWCPSRSREKLLAAAIVVASLEALPKTLVLPENPYRLAVRDWPRAAGDFPSSVRAEEQDLLAKLQPLPGRRRVLSDQVNLPHVLAAIGTAVVPPWSPEVAWLFDDRLPAAEIARRWRQSGLRYFIVGRSGPSADFIRHRARWRAPFFTFLLVAETPTQLVFEVTVAATPSP